MHLSEEKERSFWQKLFIPEYDELTLYSMSYLCLLFFFLNFKKVSFPLSDFEFTYESIMISVLFILFLSGLFLSFYHAFSIRRKALIEKKLMVIFSGILCGFAGIWGGTYMLLNSPGILTIFPIWNIICGWVLLSALRGGELSEENVSDQNIHLNVVFSGTVLVSIVFIICHFIFELNWATTFSICIAWVTTANSPLNAILVKRQTIKY